MIHDINSNDDDDNNNNNNNNDNNNSKNKNKKIKKKKTIDQYRKKQTDRQTDKQVNKQMNTNHYIKTTTTNIQSTTIYTSHPFILITENEYF